MRYRTTDYAGDAVATPGELAWTVLAAVCEPGD